MGSLKFWPKVTCIVLKKEIYRIYWDKCLPASLFPIKCEYLIFLLMTSTKISFVSHLSRQGWNRISVLVSVHNSSLKKFSFNLESSYCEKNFIWIRRIHRWTPINQLSLVWIIQTSHGSSKNVSPTLRSKSRFTAHSENNHSLLSRCYRNSQVLASLKNP